MHGCPYALTINLKLRMYIVHSTYLIVESSKSICTNLVKILCETKWYVICIEKLLKASLPLGLLRQTRRTMTTTMMAITARIATIIPPAMAPTLPEGVVVSVAAEGVVVLMVPVGIMLVVRSPVKKSKLVMPHSSYRISVQRVGIDQE